MVLDLFRLDGRVAVVTGSSRGLGAGIALALAEAGADVVCVERSADSTTADAVRALGRRAHVVTADLATASPDELAAVVDDAVAAVGRVDILVNNAGTIRRAPAAEHPAGWWDEVLAVNLDAVWHLSQAAGRHMLARGSGKILNVASMLSFQGGITVPGYTASKHAVAGLTKALANEWAAHGVNVNAVAPGYMATDNTAALRGDAARAGSISDRIPAGRWGTPADLAGAVVFLASDAAAYVHGAVIPVDGGWLVR
ncbi:2-dehydro-3-deoxy-D-gluconate 5-dehydrogenase KduD [Luteimicrobium sp. DT211]|uniref:2-dehydro-3-deoxy-D-gluconate 5-dehydrogenase KduD n=1 Tax=Luteimicrobium sp. DT211 TaxID=3393412 RepID=UPI003CFBA02D